MKITFVQPPAIMAVDNYSTITQPPLGIAYVAAFVRRIGHDVHVVDAVGEAYKVIRPWPLREKRLTQGLSLEETSKRIPKDTNIIGISCMFTHAWPMVRELIVQLKKNFPNAKLIGGGEHITSMCDTVLQQSPIDVCVLGEGEYTLTELLDAFVRGDSDYTKINGVAFINKDGKFIKTPRRKRIVDVDELPLPAWDLLNPVAYMEGEIYMGPSAGRSMPMLATRGCPYECTFCSSPNMWTRNWKARDPAKVVDEIEVYIKQYQANDFQFQDLTAIVRKDWIIAFCKELKRRKLNITWQLPVGTRSEAIDTEVAEHLISSGCHHITYAPESGSEHMLTSIKKRVNLEHLQSSAEASLKAGMRVCLFMLIGFPQETLEDIKKTFGWLKHMARIGVHEIAIATFVPLPGTELFHEISKIQPIAMDDEYCHWMTGATSLLTVRSWNKTISDRKLLFLKLWGFFQFYAVSFFYYPERLWRLIRNIFLKKQETKVDRVIREFIIKIPIALGFSKPCDNKA
ncbi:MAG: B12-binding domain-containing radical SAM protein [Planctomycetes bacterium]|nr:B12-binding domain-containing radical SAM protein [Planctomycetota bacterium]